MGARLTDFDPQIGDKPANADGSFNFKCPACRKGRIVVWVVVGGEPRNGAHIANAWPTGWDSLTVSPSIADEGKCSGTNRGCAGWHGFITNGEVTP